MVVEKVEVPHRLKHYLKHSIQYMVGVGVACAVGAFIMVFDAKLGLISVLMASALLFYRFHLKIGTTLTGSRVKRRSLFLLPVIVVSTALVVMKVYVNEPSPSGGHPLVSEGKRMLNYLLYSVWTSVVLWEAFYRLWSKRRTTKA